MSSLAAVETPLPRPEHNEAAPSIPAAAMTTTTSPSLSIDDGPSKASPPNEPPAGPPPSPYNIKSPSFWLVIISVYLAFFLIALDRMIIATAVPAITNTFDSISDIGWYGSAYMLTCAVFNPLFGSIYRFYSVKWVYMGSVALFEVGSAICGAAGSSAVFIAGRAIAGVGAAGMHPVNLRRCHMR